MPGYKAFLWCDLETTGSDELMDPIMEAAFVATDLDLNTLWEYEIVYPWTKAMEEQLSQLDVVREMHTKNGLIDHCRELASSGSCANYLSTDVDVSRLMLEHAGAEEWLLAGSGISHFDRRFVRHHYDEIESLLSYANFDIGSSRRALKLLGGERLLVEVPASQDTDAKAHRALADVFAHIEEAKCQRARLRQVDLLLQAYES